MLILVIGDVYYNDFFPSYTMIWRQGLVCRSAAFLSILSSEGSVLFITLISVDRLLAIKYPFGSHRITTKTGRISAALVWLVTTVLAAISIALASEEGEAFSMSEVCIGVPIIRRYTTTQQEDALAINTIDFDVNREFEYGHFSYSVMITGLDITINQNQNKVNISSITNKNTGSITAQILAIVIFIGINLVCFTIVAACYVKIFRSARSSTKQAARSQSREEEIRMARKMFALVFTDFCCWVPLCTVCILAQSRVISVSPEVYAWIVGFILPINSSINPFLYVIFGEILDYRKKQTKQNARRQIELN